ncbi:MAG: TerC family protein [Thainema sp.]
MLDSLLSYSSNVGVDTLLLLPVLIALEAVLSADNAIALAAIAQGLGSGTMQRRALNVGLVIAFVLRVVLILTATWVLRFWQFEVLGACYLLWLVFQHFSAEEDDEHQHHGPKFQTIWQAVPIIALTDLAFSLDSVTTAIAISRETWLVITGGLVGVITLRFMAGLFIRWLDEYVHLEDAGFITVGFVGVRLLVRVINENWVPPEWVMVSLIAILFIWGFSKRVDEEPKIAADGHHVNKLNQNGLSPVEVDDSETNDHDEDRSRLASKIAVSEATSSESNQREANSNRA